MLLLYLYPYYPSRIYSITNATASVDRAKYLKFGQTGKNLLPFKANYEKIWQEQQNTDI